MIRQTPYDLSSKGVKGMIPASADEHLIKVGGRRRTGIWKYVLNDGNDGEIWSACFLEKFG